MGRDAGRRWPRFPCWWGHGGSWQAALSILWQPFLRWPWARTPDRSDRLLPVLLLHLVEPVGEEAAGRWKDREMGLQGLPFQAQRGAPHRGPCSADHPHEAPCTQEPGPLCLWWSTTRGPQLAPSAWETLRQGRSGRRSNLVGALPSPGPALSPGKQTRGLGTCEGHLIGGWIQSTCAVLAFFLLTNKESDKHSPQRP